MNSRRRLRITVEVLVDVQHGETPESIGRKFTNDILERHAAQSGAEQPGTETQTVAMCKLIGARFIW